MRARESTLVALIGSLRHEAEKLAPGTRRELAGLLGPLRAICDSLEDIALALDLVCDALEEPEDAGEDDGE